MAELYHRSGKPFLVIGRAGMDLYADPPGARSEEATRFSTALGGSSANIAASLTRQGCAAALVTCVSDDAIGRFVLNELDRYGIDRRHVRVVGGERRTSLALVETRIDDHQSVIYRNNAADFAMTVSDVEAVDYTAFVGLIVTGTALAAEPSRSATFRALALAGAANLPRILDIDYRPYSWPSAQDARDTCARAAEMCDVVVGNDVEFGLLAGDAGATPEAGLAAARALVGRGAGMCVYKMGERGAITLTPDDEFATGIYRTQALKPTGAGDSFLGAMAAALCEGRTLRDCVLRGTAAAAMVVARTGCAPAMPTSAEIDAFITANPAPATV